jgi:hypothetical protein
VTASLGGPCAVGIGVLLACSAGLFAAATWPGYFLALFQVSESTQLRVWRRLTRAIIGLFVTALAGALVLLVLQPC